MNEDEAKAFEKRKKEIIDFKIDLLDKYMDEWNQARIEGNTNFTEGDIGLLAKLAEKNLKNCGNKQGLNDNQRKAKQGVRRRTRNSLADLNRMVRNGFIGIGSGSMANSWNPKVWDSDKDRYMFDIEDVKEDLPVQSLTNVVQALVELYGDKYAIPLADAIRQGLITFEGSKKREPWESVYDIDVPILRRTQKSLW